MNRPLAASVAAALVGIGAFLYHPHTGPALIRWKMRIVGPGFVCRTLAFDNRAWEFVTNRMRAGGADWLNLANDCKSFLDAHPGEEMMDAVSRSIDADPKGALTILLPVYGAKRVCAETWEGEGLKKEDFLRRLNQIDKIPNGEIDKKAVDACTKEIAKTILDLKRQWP